MIFYKIYHLNCVKISSDMPVESNWLNMQSLLAAQTQNQHNICECVWCKPYFSSSINQLTETINLKISDLDILKEAVKKKSLVPHPGDTIETTSLEVNLSRSVVDSTMAHFLLAASEGNINVANIAARNTSNALRDFTQFIGCYVSTLSNTETKFQVIDMAKDVLEKSTRLVNEAHNTLRNPNQTNKARLSKAGIDPK